MELSSLHPLVQLLLALLSGFGLHVCGHMSATFWRQDAGQPVRTVAWCRGFAMVCALAGVGFGVCAVLYLVGGVVVPAMALYGWLVL